MIKNALASNKLVAHKLIAVIVLTLFACSRPSPLNAPASPILGGETHSTPDGTPTPTPTPKKEPLWVWRCKVSNGAGRVLIGIDESRDVAESRARQRCTQSYRNCTLLSCESIEAESEFE